MKIRNGNFHRSLKLKRQLWTILSWLRHWCLHSQAHRHSETRFFFLWLGNLCTTPGKVFISLRKTFYRGLQTGALPRRLNELEKNNNFPEWGDESDFFTQLVHRKMVIILNEHDHSGDGEEKWKNHLSRVAVKLKILKTALTKALVFILIVVSLVSCCFVIRTDNEDWLIFDAVSFAWFSPLIRLTLSDHQM